MIHTNIIAKIEKYDPDKNLADLEPLFLDENEQPYEKIVNARVLSQRFLMPKKIILEGGEVNHSNIHDANSHIIFSGHQIIKRDKDADHEEFELFPLYKKGDIVMVSVIERDLSDAVDGSVGNGGNWMLHDLSSAVVVGRVAM